MASASANPLNLALLQMRSTTEVGDNIQAMEAGIRAAADAGAQLVATPEMCSLMDIRPGALAQKAMREADDACLHRMQALAATHGIHLLLGSLPIACDDGRYANRSVLLGPDGTVLARYDKIHMFDVELSDTEAYHESATYRAGDSLVTATAASARLGLSICYDVRFPALYRRLAQAGADILSVPAAFTRTTGRAHWHVLLRARAIETGCFAIAPAQGGHHADGRETYGHSLVVSPWGEVIAEKPDDAPGLLMAEIDLGQVAEARRRIPSLHLDAEMKAATSG